MSSVIGLYDEGYLNVRIEKKYPLEKVTFAYCSRLLLAIRKAFCERKLLSIAHCATVIVRLIKVGGGDFLPKQ